MFKHILLPTDGSELSKAAIQKGILFAKSIDAKVTGLHVVEPSRSLSIGSERVRNTEEQYYADARLQAENYLSVIETAAKEASVSCETLTVSAHHAYEAIIRTADEKGCDLILMASHGRRGAQGLLIGSETNKVLTHTKLPVLVLR